MYPVGNPALSPDVPDLDSIQQLQHAYIAIEADYYTCWNTITLSLRFNEASILILWFRPAANM